MIRNRIKELRMMKASELADHPENWRRHPERQKSALRSVLGEIGYADAVVAYETPEGLRLVDGHLRKDVAGDDVIPVLVTDLDEQEARAVLATMDPLAMMADSRGDLLLQLSDKALEFESVGLVLDALFKPLESDFQQEKEDDAQEPEALPEDYILRGDVPDAVWPTDNELEIPALDISMQADALDVPVSVWGMGRYKAANMRGTWLFYTEDDYLTRLWRDPSGPLNTKAVNCAEVNFSAYGQTPIAMAVYRTYQKRWLARYWQSKGMRIFVDLNVNEKFYGINMLGVPEGWAAYCTRGYTQRQDALIDQYEIAKARAGREPLFVVYSGGDVTRQLCKERGWIWIADINTYGDDMVRKGWQDEIKAVKR